MNDYKKLSPDDVNIQDDSRIDELRRICRPVVEYLQKKWHPHARIIIDWDRVSLYQEELGIPFRVSD